MIFYHAGWRMFYTRQTVKKVGVQLTVKEISTQTAYAIMEHYGFDKSLGYMLPPFRIQKLADCIIMEQIKLLFEETLPSKSMRTHLLEAGIADEADYVRHARLLQYAILCIYCYR